jgi:hypothetical protein
MDGATCTAFCVVDVAGTSTMTELLLASVLSVAQTVGAPVVVIMVYGTVVLNAPDESVVTLEVMTPCAPLERVTTAVELGVKPEPETAMALPFQAADILGLIEGVFFFTVVGCCEMKYAAMATAATIPPIARYSGMLLPPLLVVSGAVPGTVMSCSTMSKPFNR